MDDKIIRLLLDQGGRLAYEETLEFTRAQSVAVVADSKTNGTNGGTFTQGAWRTRDINAELSDADSIVSVASNQFTLIAGTYFIYWAAPAFAVERHRSKLYDVTGAADVVMGTAAYAYQNGTNFSHSLGCMSLTIAASNTYEIQHYCQSTYATFGFGVAGGSGLGTIPGVEIYTLAGIWRIK